MFALESRLDVPGRDGFQLRLLRIAEQEMFAGADRYDLERPGLGNRFLAAIEVALTSVLQGPHRWPKVDERHHRRLVQRFPFGVFYRIDDVTVVVVAISHHKRMPQHWRDR